MGDSEKTPTNVYITKTPVPVKSIVGYGSGKLPENAVVLTDSEVLEVQDKIIREWKPRRDMAAFTYGWGVVGGITVICGAILNAHYRKKFQLFEHRRFATYAQSTIIPCITALFANRNMVTEPILLRKYTCPMCIELRGAVIQAAVVTLQVPVLSFLSCAVIAQNEFRYTLPPLSDISGWLKAARKMTKPLYGTILTMAFFNMLYVGALTYKQMRASHLIHEKMLKEIR